MTDHEAERRANRRRTALHEAAHAVAHAVLGVPIEYASIRSGRMSLGIVVGVQRDRPRMDGFEGDYPVPTQPPELRADVERSIIVTLAGDLAELYLDEQRGSAYTNDEAETAAVAALATLGPRLADLVVHLEESESVVGDEDAARNLAVAFAGREVGPLYLGWLRASAGELVITYRAAILRVADALERRAVLAGPAIAALVHPPKGAPDA